MNDYQKKLKKKMDDYVHLVYLMSKRFPKEEAYGITSQFRRASLSIVLNYIEGYARFRSKVRFNHLEVAFGSFKESQYLLEFVLIEKLITRDEYSEAHELCDQIGAMLWTELDNLSRSIKSK